MTTEQKMILTIWIAVVIYAILITILHWMS